MMAAQQTWRGWLLGLLAVAATLSTCTATVADPDLWGHTLYGLRAWDAGVLCERTDPFSYTAPQALWINHEWLTELAYGQLWRRGGQGALWMWRNVHVALLFGLGAWAIHRARVGIGSTILLLGFAAQTLEPFCMFIRPQLSTFVLLAWWLLIARRHWEGVRDGWIWTLPVASALWVNLHGGFLAGLALHGAITVAYAWRAWRDGKTWRACGEFVAVGAACGLATLLNPYGWEMHRMLWVHLAPAQAVREWAPLWTAGGSIVYYLPLIVCAVALAGCRRWDAFEVIVLAATVFAAVSHLRHVALLSVTTLIILPRALDESLGRLLPRLAATWNNPLVLWRPLAAATLAAAGLFASQVAFVHGWTRHGLRPWEIGVESLRQTPGVPLRALTVLEREQLDGNLLTDYAWAQYVMWHRFPQNPVAFDGRYRTVYPWDIEQDFLAFLRSDPSDPRTFRMLDAYPTEIVLLPAAAPASAAVAARPDWCEIYRDEQARLFVRRTPRFAQVIARAEQQSLAEPAIARWNLFPAGPRS